MKQKTVFQTTLLALLLLGLVVLVRLPSIHQPLDNDSSGVAYEARLILQGEPLYGTHHPAHHLPGVYYAYALIFRILGDRPESIKLFLIFWVWLNAWVIFEIGHKLAGQAAGMLATVLFILVGSMTNLLGDSGEIELFANLSITLIIWLGILFQGKPGHPAKYSLIGILAAISFYFKAVYLSSLAAVGLSMFIQAILARKKQAWLEFLERCIAILAGAAGVLGLVGLYFASVGLWSRFLLVFQLGTSYVGMNNESSLGLVLLVPAIIIGQVNLTLLALGCIGALNLLLKLPRTLPADQSKGLAQITLVGWLFGSFVAAGASRFGFAHYGLLLVPPLTLLTAIETVNVWQIAAPAFVRGKFRFQILLPALMLLAVFANTIYTSRNYLGGYIKYITSKITWTEFVRSGTLQGDRRLTSVEIAEYVKQRTNPDDTVFSWATQSQIYYVADRRSSSDVIWAEDIAQLGPPERVFAQKPVYIIVGATFAGQKNVPDWLTKELARSYTLETVISEHEIYRRNAP